MFRRTHPPVPVWIAVVLSMATGVAFAQGGDAEVDVVKLEGLAAPAAPSVSASDQAKKAAKIEERAGHICGRQTEMLNNARRGRDIIQATCLDDKLTQCNAYLSTVRARRKALESAIRENDAGAAKHESRVLGVLDQKFQILDHAASQCIGQDIFETGLTNVSMEVDADSPEEDATTPPPAPVAPVPTNIPPPVSGTT